jgi:hypothetical protein
MNKRNIKLSKIVFTAVAGFLFLGVSMQKVAAGPAEQQMLIDKAHLTFQSFMRDDNMSWLHENLDQAKGVLIVPSVLKGGFIVGGSGGRGVLVVKDAKTGQYLRLSDLWAADRWRGSGSGYDGEIAERYR